MLTKLTLTVDENVVKQAKNYAQKKNRSVSRIVEEYLKNISENNSYSLKETPEAPITEILSGMFADAGKSYETLLEEALLEKYL